MTKVMNFKGDEIPRIPLLGLLSLVTDEHSCEVVKAFISSSKTNGLVYFKGYGETGGFIPYGPGHLDKTVEELARIRVGDDLVAVSWADKRRAIIRCQFNAPS